MNHAPPPPEPPESWPRLADWHRLRTDSQDDAAPLGFSTRMAARWLAQRGDDLRAAWERASVRAAFACSVLALTVTVVCGFPGTGPTLEAEDEILILPEPERLDAAFPWFS